MTMSTQKDKIIRSTDLDLLSSRSSANLYLQDPLLSTMVEGVQNYLPLSSPINLSIKRNLNKYFGINAIKKNPIINRGTYIRTKSIDLIVNLFIKSCANKFSQIVSIGCGSDTRFLNLLNNSQDDNNNISIFEYDFIDSIKIKKLTIINDTKLRDIIQYKEEPQKISITNFDEFDELDPILNTLNYHLLPIDLRQLDDTNFKELDPNLPTLVLSECVLCYMSPQDSKQVITRLTDLIKSGIFVVYEPMGGDDDMNNNMGDNFGQVMTKNLSNRGIELPSLLEFNNLTNQFKRFDEFKKFNQIKLSDLKFVYHHWLDEKELNRINKLEFLDELEEFDLINSHYCICLLTWGDLQFEFNKPFQIDEKR